ncbi:MAG: Rne/Rng family ribonuclease [Thermodesulfobacteriota bacterium]
MDNQILINVTYNETRVAVMENGSPAELYIERKSTPRIVGNIYKGKVGKVVPGMQAAFIDIGIDKSGFISVEDVQEDSLYEYFLDSGGEDAAKDFSTQQHNLIQDILREGQHLMVQVLKESVGGKGAKLSSYVAIPGKYLVLLGTIDIVGISRKIEDTEERERLTELLNKIKPDGTGLIARTASENITEDELEHDLRELLSIWEGVKKANEETTVPSLLYEEPRLYIKAVRDFISNDVKKVIIDSEYAYNEIKEYLRANFPDSLVNIELYQDSEPIFSKYGVDNDIKKIFKKKVWLKSGGHIIIEEAEGLTVVDVNTGRYQSGKDQEETIYNLNVEAALEIVRQIRLRNLVGIIVIDFIDIKNRQLRDSLFENFVDALKQDRARSVVHEMSSFGVIQMTRQRLRESILNELAEPCFYCEGAGYLKSLQTISYEIIRDIRKRINKALNKKIIVVANPEVIKSLNESENQNLNQLQEKYSIELDFRESEERIEKYKLTIE